MKQCSKCGISKPLDNFHTDRSKKDGRRGYCKDCHNKMNAGWEKKNPDRVKAYKDKWAIANEAKIAEYAKAHAAQNRKRANDYYWSHRQECLRKMAERDVKNPARRLERQRRWVAANLGKKRAYDAAYWKANLERTLARNSAARARKRCAVGRYTGEDIKKLYALQKGRCALCHVKLAKVFHRDHIVSLINGGTNYISNIQLLCVSCNCSKGAKDPITYAQQHGRLL